MRTKANREIKQLMREKDITQHDIAKVMGLSETTLYRRLRDELEEEQSNQIKEIINELSSNQF